MTDDGVLHVVMGATGRIGGAVASTLLEHGRRVRALTRNAQRAGEWNARGAEVAVADLLDPDTLRSALADDGPVRVFALNPPAPVDGDTDREEQRTGDAIAAALGEARLDRVVLLSTYGARPGTRIGDLGTLHRLEQRLRPLSAPVATVRAAYLYSNWDGALAGARESGRLTTMLDPDRALPMVDPTDVGRVAAELLTDPTAIAGVVHVEGPRRYSPRDVAAILSRRAGRRIDVERVPPAAWRDAFAAAGFSPEAADSYLGMTTITADEPWVLDGEPVRGRVLLEDRIG